MEWNWYSCKDSEIKKTGFAETGFLKIHLDVGKDQKDAGLHAPPLRAASTDAVSTGSSGSALSAGQLHLLNSALAAAGGLFGLILLILCCGLLLCVRKAKRDEQTSI